MYFFHTTDLRSWNIDFLGVRSPAWLPKVRRGPCLDLTNLKVERGSWTGIFSAFKENFWGCQLLNHIEENTSCVSYFVVVFVQPIAATVLVFQSYSASPSVFHLKPDKYSLISLQPHLNLNLLLNPSSHLTRCKSCSIWEGNLWQKAFLQESAVRSLGSDVPP